MKLLLINPENPESFWSFKWAVDTFLPNKKNVNPPLGLATLAALCPEDWEVEIIDENIEPIPLTPNVDIVGICGMGAQFKRQKKLLALYRNKGYFVVAGGSYASLCHELYKGLSDTIIAGEAEYIWKEFCVDFELKKAKPLYQEKRVVSMSHSPVPRYDLLNLNKYQSAIMQFSRGCPYTCEFCDIVVMFGRKVRNKSLRQVEKELDLLRKLNVQNIYFADDNLIGNKRSAKDLLRFIIHYQKKHDYIFYFGTQASLNVANDNELLTLFQQANFASFFIGIESTNEESLRHAGKFHNISKNILHSVQNIYSYGIDVRAGFIIGFDCDTIEVFDRQYEFIIKSGIQISMIGLLIAFPNTPLYKRLEKEGRLIPDANNYDNTKPSSNVIYKNIEYKEMMKEYRKLYYRLFGNRNIASRIRNKVRFLHNPVYKKRYPLNEQLRILVKFLFHGLMPGGLSRLFHFAQSVPLTRPQLFSFVVENWIAGLAIRNYIDRHFVSESDTEI